MFRAELQPPSHPEMLFCFWTTSLLGLTNSLVSVIGPQLITGEFEEFLKQRGIVHCQTSVYNPAANGRVERVNRNISKLLEVQSHLQNFKTLQEVLNDYFTNYNNTQHDTNGKNPTSFLLRLNPRTRLDILPASTGEHSFAFLKPSEQFKGDDTNEIETRTRTKQNSLQNYANQRRRPTKTNKFHVGDSVITPGCVTKVLKAKIGDWTFTTDDHVTVNAKNSRKKPPDRNIAHPEDSSIDL
jgi:hypothetical protein